MWFFLCTFISGTHACAPWKAGQLPHSFCATRQVRLFPVWVSWFSICKHQPSLLADQSDLDVHGALQPDQVPKLYHVSHGTALVCSCYCRLLNSFFLWWVLSYRIRWNVVNKSIYHCIAWCAQLVCGPEARKSVVGRVDPGLRPWEGWNCVPWKR